MDQLAPGKAHVWWTPVPEMAPTRVDELARLLDVEETGRAGRFLFARDRALFTAAHAQLRRVLSRYAAVAPEAWRFQVGESGRPALASSMSGQVSTPLHFNLSHTHGMVASVVYGDALCGIDVERTARTADLLDVARSSFAEPEWRALEELPAEQQREQFFQIWTLKEAYVKARGGGIGTGLDRFRFAVDGGSVRVRFDAALHEDADRWTFQTGAPSPQHRMSVALWSAPGTPVDVVTRTLALEDL